MKTLEDEWYVVITAYTSKFTVLEILRDFLVVLRIPTHRVFRLHEMKYAILKCFWFSFS